MSTIIKFALNCRPGLSLLGLGLTNFRVTKSITNSVGLIRPRRNIFTNSCRYYYREKIYVNITNKTTRNVKQFCQKTIKKEGLRRSFSEVSSFFTNSIKGIANLKTKIFANVVGISCSYKWICRSAFCESSSKTRLVGIDIDRCDEAEFDWKMFFALFKPEVWYFVIAVVSALIVAVLNIQIASVLGDVVNVITHFVRTSGVEPSTFLAEVKSPAFSLVQMYVSQSFFTFLYISVLSHSGERIACRLRQDLFASIIKQDIEFFDAHKTGEIITRLTSDVQEFKSSLKMCISQGLRSLTQTAGSIISLYLISPKMTGLMVVVLPSLIMLGSAIGSGLRTLSKTAQAQIARAASVADEAIGNIRTVRAFAMEPKEIQLYNAEVEEARKLQTKLGIGVGIFQGLTNLALNGIVLGVLFVGGSLLSSLEISPGSLMSFLVASQTIQRSLGQLSLLYGQCVRGMAAGTRVFQYIQLVPKTPLSNGATLSKEKVRGNVEFTNVTFTYPTRPEQIVLHDFNLSIPAGVVVALCGPSGGGKSTIASLLERFYEIDNGTIILDGHDLRDLDPSWLRGQVIGFISQEPVLFATSIMENIRYGRPESTDVEVLEAAKLANAHDFISHFPNGYHTLLGERGVTVSGGQKQRIAIARALLKDPAILILDEATSALDAESEKIVQEALDKVVNGRTVLVIAHRLSTIQNAEVIAVLSNGKVAELGSHRNLMKKRGLYWDLARRQNELEGESTKQGA